MICPISDIRQGFEYVLISEYTRVLNIPEFWMCQGYKRFWIKDFVIDVWQYSESVLDPEYEYSEYTKLCIKFSILDIWLGFEYALGSEYTTVTQGSVENNPSYMFDRFLSISWALSMLELKYTRVVNMPKLQMVRVKCILKIFSIECPKFWIC